MDAEQQWRLSGQVTDTETLLDGRRSYTVLVGPEPGELEEHAETEVTLTFVWDPVSGAPVDEGDLTMAGAEGSWQGVVSGGQAGSESDPDTGDELLTISLEGEIVESSDPRLPAGAHWTVAGSIAGDDVSLELRLDAGMGSDS